MPVIGDLLSRASNGTPPEVTVLASQKLSGASSLSLDLATGWDTTTPVHFLLYEVDANNKLVLGSETLWKGILSGTTVSNLTLRGGTDTTYPSGSPVELAFTSAQLDDLITALQASHNPDGTIKSNIPLTTPVLTSPTTKGLVSGWVGANESWSYASASTITVPSDATLKYDPGDFLQLTQSSTVKYFVIASVTATVLTVVGIGGAVVANSTISLNSYSKQANPHGIGLNPGIIGTTLGYAQITSTFTSTGGVAATQVPGLSVSATIPAGGRRVKITAYCGNFATNSGAPDAAFLSIWDGAVGTSGTLIAVGQVTSTTNGFAWNCTAMAVVSLPAGSKTYNAAVSASSGQPVMTVDTTQPGFILVEAI